MSCRQGIIYDPWEDEWRPTRYEGYFVSYQGKVVGPGRHGEPELLKPLKANRYGHLEVNIHENGKRIHEYIHRLVATAFIPNPHKYPIVRHLDGDVLNNCANNLAWGTQVDNMQDCIRDGNFRYFTNKDRELAMAKRRTPIIAIDLSNGERTYFISQQEASRALSMHQSCINAVLRGERNQSKGYSFEYAEEVYHD